MDHDTAAGSAIADQNVAVRPTAAAPVSCVRAALAAGLFLLFTLPATALAGGDHATIAQRDDEALESLSRAAALGSASAQYRLGDMYLRGRGVRQDLLKAARWYRRAAEQGHVHAQYVLGVMYQLGGGVDVSFAKAASWFKRAADQGHAGAQHELGKLYYAGQGVPKDYVAAYMWQMLARANGSSSRTRAAAVQAIERLEPRMTPAQIAEAKRQAHAWRATQEGGAGAQ